MHPRNCIDWLSGLIPSRKATATAAGRKTGSRLQMERLEDRTVPSGTPLDLTFAGAAGTVNGAIFEQGSTQPAGCGVIHDFLRVQAHGAKQTVEQGYNSDTRPVQFDEKTDPNFTRALHLSELTTVNVAGVTYRVMLLGVNQKQSSPLLSLDELRVYVSDSPTLSGYDATTHQLGGVAPVYDMTAGNDTWVELNSSLSHGNGSTDMVLFLPDSLFASANPDPYVSLYSKFGMNCGANGGFEAWAPGKGPVSPPASLSGYVFVDSNNNGTFDAGESGLGGVLLTLTGVNSQGQQVTMTTTTAADGSYAFVGLTAGTYTITETQPGSYLPGKDSVGTVNGVTDGLNPISDVLSSIYLKAGQQGINYDFGNLLAGS